MIRVFFLIRSLEVGGAERQLIEIVRGLDKREFAVAVATFYDGGALRAGMEAIEGVRLVSLAKKGRWDVFPFLANLSKAVRDFAPDILFGAMSPANELGWAMGRIVGAKVVWALRTSYLNFSDYDWLIAFLHRLGALLSPRADLIIANSEAGRRYHQESGYATERMIVIHNGIDTAAYRPDEEARARVRAEWNIRSEQKLIGLVARLDPIKDHPTFFRAAAILSSLRPDLRFVCVGDGPPNYGRELRRMAASLGVEVLWAGVRSDMRAVYNALDVACCSSYGEGFPNAVAEAMACGVPCVATDVGDLRLLLGGTGQIVPPRNPQALAAGLNKLLEDLDSNGENCRWSARERILLEFDVSRLAEQTSAALQGLVAARAEASPSCSGESVAAFGKDEHLTRKGPPGKPEI